MVYTHRFWWCGVHLSSTQDEFDCKKKREKTTMMKVSEKNSQTISSLNYCQTKNIKCNYFNIVQCVLNSHNDPKPAALMPA